MNVVVITIKLCKLYILKFNEYLCDFHGIK